LRFFVQEGKLSHAQLDQLSSLSARVKLAVALGLEQEHGLLPKRFCALFPHSYMPSDHSSTGSSTDSSVAGKLPRIALVLSLVDAMSRSGEGTLDIDWVRGALYGHSLGKGKPWSIPPVLAPTAQAWGTYVRNDLLSIATQTVFFSSLFILGNCDRRFDTAEGFGNWLSGRPAIKKLGKVVGGATFGEALRLTKWSAPPQEDWNSDRHEFQYAFDCMARFREKDDEASAASAIGVAVRTLVLLAARIDPHVPAHDASLLAEEFLKGSVDDQPEFEEMHDSEIAKLCRGKTRRLVGRMVKQMEQAARRAENGPTVLIQLVAVLAIIRELRLVGRMPRWASIRESLVNHDDEEILLDEILTNLFGHGYQLYQAITTALGDERFDELARLKGLLIWLAWDCKVQLDDRFDIREEPEDVRQRLREKATLLEFAQMLKGDAVAQDEAANSILQTVKGGAATAATRWVTGYFGWADRISRTAIPAALGKVKPNIAIAVGDLAVVLTKDTAPRLRVVSAVTGQQVSLIDFGDEGGEIEFLKDRVIKVA